MVGEGRKSAGIEKDPVERTFSMSIKRRISYDVRMVSRLFDVDNSRLANYLHSEREALHGFPMIIVDSTVKRLHGARIRRYFDAHGLYSDRHWYEVDCDLGCKQQTTLFDMLGAIGRAGLSRRSPLVLIGGGTLLDVGGLAATLHRRGTPHIRIPTTLVGMVDAGVGIKTGINFAGHKNRLGSFYPPETVFNDVGFLETLPRHHIRQGLAEIAKMGIVVDARITDFLESHGRDLLFNNMAPSPQSEQLIDLAITSMLDCLAMNLFEDLTLEREVDFGHAISPWIEMTTNESVLHGDAVAIDMAIMTQTMQLLGRCSEGTVQRVFQLLESLTLPIYHPVCDDVAGMQSSLEDLVYHRGGDLNLPYPPVVGKALFYKWSRGYADEMARARREFFHAMQGAVNLVSRRARLTRGAIAVSENSARPLLPVT